MRISVLILLLVACGKKDAENSRAIPPMPSPVDNPRDAGKDDGPSEVGKTQAPEIGVPSDAQAAYDSQPVAEPIYATVSKLAPQCFDPCLALQSEPLGAFDILVFSSCDDCAELEDSCYQAAESMLRCDNYDYLRNCIYAGAGQEFKKEKWKTLFSEKAWYAPKKKRDRLSSVASQNVEGLKLLKRACEGSQVDFTFDEDLWAKKGKKYTAESDLDGDGVAEKIVLGDGVVSIDGVQAELDGFDGADIVQIGGKRYLLLSEYADEDDHYYRFVIQRPDGLRIGKEFGPVPERQLKILPDGTIRTTFKSCGTIEQEDYRLEPKTGRVRRVSRKRAGKVDEGLCVACPYVYAIDEKGVRHYQGEILRNLRAERLASLQSLAAGPLLASEIVLREEKEEVTFLDEFYVETDRRERVIPVSCLAEDRSFCQKDGEHYQLSKDEELVMRFDLHPGESITKFWAFGYYLPRSLRSR